MLSFAAHVSIQTPTYITYMHKSKVSRTSAGKCSFECVTVDMPMDLQQQTGCVSSSRTRSTELAELAAVPAPGLATELS